MLLQELDYIVTAEQTNDTITPFDPLLTDRLRLVRYFISLQCLNICSQVALYLQTPPGHTGASTIS
jgi:hypothetical protein